MHYWIDGYNFFFRLTKNYTAMREQERELLHKLYKTMQHLSSQMTVVFDGREKDPPEALLRNLRSMKIVYTPATQTADQYILEMLEHTKNRAQETVVSSDRDLLRKAKQMRALTLTVEEFLRSLSDKKRAPLEEKKQTQESSAEFTRLLKIFEDQSSVDN